MTGDLTEMNVVKNKNESLLRKRKMSVPPGAEDDAAAAPLKKRKLSCPVDAASVPQGCFASISWGRTKPGLLHTRTKCRRSGSGAPTSHRRRRGSTPQIVLSALLERCIFQGHAPTNWAVSRLSLQSPTKQALIHAIDHVCCVTADVMHDASRVLHHFLNGTLASGGALPLNDDGKVFYGMLVDWAIAAVVEGSRSGSVKSLKESQAAVSGLEWSAKALGCFRRHCCRGLSAILHACALSWVTQCTNMLFKPWPQHLALYLRAKYSD